MKALYRVECNNGSKYFDNCFAAIAFFNLKREQPMASVQLWKFVSPTTQELISPIPTPTKSSHITKRIYQEQRRKARQFGERCL